MKREFLEGLGIDKDTIDRIMTENGNDINREREKADSYKTQLDAAKASLKAFEGVDVAQLQGQIAKLNNDLTAKEAEHAKAIADRDFKDMVKRLAAEYKARDVEAVMPFLDIEKLKASKNQEADVKAAFDEVKKARCISLRTPTSPETNESVCRIFSPVPFFFSYLRLLRRTYRILPKT